MCRAAAVTRRLRSSRPRRAELKVSVVIEPVVSMQFGICCKCSPAGGCVAIACRIKIHKTQFIPISLASTSNQHCDPLFADEEIVDLLLADYSSSRISLNSLSLSLH